MIRAVLLAALAAAPQEPVRVAATVETDPVHHSGDSADDPAIWVHPSDPGLSTVIGDDKNGGICVYALDGRELQHIDGGKDMNNVDVRYGFALKGAFGDGAAHDRVDFLGVGNESDRTLAFYKINPKSRLLEPAGAFKGARTSYGSCLYRSPKTGKFHFFNTTTSGFVEQWELRDDGKGGVAGVKVREFDVGTTVEGCVADDVHAKFYVGEEGTGIWNYGAEPGDGDARVAVDRCGAGGHLTADVEGLAICSFGEKEGYLLASSQGNDSFTIYERTGANRHLGTFKLVDGKIDGVSDTDGIEVTSAALGPLFPKGLFVAQDGSNPGAHQNYKLVPWEAIAEKFTPPLRIDPSWSPRPPK